VDTVIGSSETNRDIYVKGVGNVRVDSTRTLPGDRFTIHAIRTTGNPVEVDFTGFSNVYVSGEGSLSPIAGKLLYIPLGSHIIVRHVWDVVGTSVDVVVSYSVGHKGWVLGDPHYADEYVVYTLNGKAYQANNNMIAGTAWAIGLGEDQWRLAGTRMPYTKEHDATASYTYGDWVTYEGDTFYATTNTGPSAFLVAKGMGDWYHVGSVRAHDPQETYVQGGVVYMFGRIYSANTAMGASTFTTGTGVGEWSDITKDTTPILHVMNNLTFDVGPEHSGNAIHTTGTESALTIDQLNFDGDESFEVYNTANSPTELKFVGFTNIDVRGPGSTLYVAESSVWLYTGEHLKVHLDYNIGTVGIVTYGSGHAGWVLGSLYVINESVMKDGIWYRANSHILANVPFVEGTELNEWRLGHLDNPVRNNVPDLFVNNDAANKTFLLGIDGANTLYIQEVVYSGITPDLTLYNDSATKHFRIGVNAADSIYLLEIPL
jgi:hypothetical protein